MDKINKKNWWQGLGEWKTVNVKRRFIGEGWAELRSTQIISVLGLKGSCVKWVIIEISGKMYSRHYCKNLLFCSGYLLLVETNGERENSTFLVGTPCFKIFFIRDESNFQRENELISVICCHHLQAQQQHLWNFELNPPTSLVSAFPPSVVGSMSQYQGSWPGNKDPKRARTDPSFPVIAVICLAHQIK